MSRSALKNKGMVLAEHSTALSFPITYILHNEFPDNEDTFKVSIYHERYLLGNQTTPDANNQIPFATWTPKRGLFQLNFAPFVCLRDAGLLPEMESFCERAYEAWKRSRDDADEDDD